MVQASKELIISIVILVATTVLDIVGSYTPVGGLICFATMIFIDPESVGHERNV
jgi:hypothetical protein